VKNPLQKSRIPEGKAFVIQELIAPYFDVNWHFHSEYQLFVVLKGRGTRFVGDQTSIFKEGDMVLTGPNLPHLWKNDAAYHDPSQRLETHGIVIYFPDHFLNNSVFELEEMEAIAKLLQRSSRGIEVQGTTQVEVRKMMVQLLELKGTSRLLHLLQILDRLAGSSECVAITDAAYINTNKESEKDRMGQVYEYVMQHFASKITLQEVAQLSNLSVSAFSRYFKSRVNKPFSDFLTEVRISHACKLLHESDQNISEIAFSCGFYTLSNFNKLFRERLHKSPKEYRKEFQASRFL
jgi:AraC-like DNA-binding protein